MRHRTALESVAVPHEVFLVIALELLFWPIKSLRRRVRDPEALNAHEVKLVRDLHCGHRLKVRMKSSIEQAASVEFLRSPW